MRSVTHLGLAAALTLSVAVSQPASLVTRGPAVAGPQPSLISVLPSPAHA